MTTKTTAEWLDGTLKTSEKMDALLQLQTLDDSFGWGKILSAMWEMDPANRPCGLLLTGPDGCGKHTASFHMLRLLRDEGFYPVYLDWTTMGASNFSEAKARLESLLDHCYHEGQALCIVLEQMEHCPCRQEVLSYLGLTLLEYHSMPDELPALFLILIDHQESRIPALLRKCLRLCRMSLPTEERRKLYLQENAGSLARYIPMDQVAAAAQGFTYSQLADLLSNLGSLLDSMDGYINEEDWRVFLTEQMPERSQEDVSRLLTRTLQQLLEQLPQLLQGGNVTAGLFTSRNVSNQEQSVSTASPDLTRSEIENMPPAQLAIDLFGEERAQRIANAYAEN